MGLRKEVEFEIFIDVDFVLGFYMPLKDKLFEASSSQKNIMHFIHQDAILQEIN